MLGSHSDPIIRRQFYPAVTSGVSSNFPPQIWYTSSSGGATYTNANSILNFTAGADAT